MKPINAALGNAIRMNFANSFDTNCFKISHRGNVEIVLPVVAPATILREN